MRRCVAIPLEPSPFLCRANRLAGNGSEIVVVEQSSVKINMVGGRFADNFLCLIGITLVSEKDVRHRTVHVANLGCAPTLKRAVSPLGPLLETSRHERVNHYVVAIWHMIFHHVDERVQARVEIAQIEDVVKFVGCR